MNRKTFLIAFLLVTFGSSIAANRRTRPEIANEVEGSFTFAGKTTKVTHAYARMLKNDVAILFTDNLVAQETLTDDGVNDPELSRKTEGRKVLGFYVVITPSRQVNFKIFHGGQYAPLLSSGATFKPALFNRQTVQGEVSTKGTIFKDEYSFTATFKVSLRPRQWTGVFYILPPTNLEPGVSIDPTDEPITAQNGQPLPPGGGAPGQAYLQIARAMMAARNARDLARVMNESEIATLSRQTVPAPSTPLDRETENALFQLLRKWVVENPRVESGFINNDKATLSIVGSRDGKRVYQRLNMHLENGRWKMGAGKIEFK